MEKELIKLQMKDMTRHKLYKLFDIKRVRKIVELEEWLECSSTIDLKSNELAIIETFQKILIKNIESWNENDLSLGFIGPIINMIDFKIPYQLNFFTQRSIKGIVGKYEIAGKPDGIIASGEEEPERPFFKFHEYKREVDSSGDPIGQNLAAMLVGQTLNENQEVVYGCYVIGRNWYFMVLKGKEYAISRDYSATQPDDILDIVKILKALRSILFKKLNIVTDN